MLPESFIAIYDCIDDVKYVIGTLVKVPQLTYWMIGYGLSVKLAFKLTIIPDPELTLNVVDPVAAVIKPPFNNPVYKLPSNQRKRVVLLYPFPF